MPVVRQWLWLVADEPIAHRQRLLFQELQLGFHRRIEVDIVVRWLFQLRHLLLLAPRPHSALFFAVVFAFFRLHLRLWSCDNFELCGHGVGFQTFAHESGLLQWLQW